MSARYLLSTIAVGTLLTACADREEGDEPGLETGLPGPDSGEFGEEGDGDGDGDGDGEGDGGGDGDGDGDGDGETGGGDTGDGDGDGGGDGDGDGDGDTGGNGGICGPTNGAGGPTGLNEIAAPAYPNVPGMIYVPSNYSEQTPTPVMVALHGSGDTAPNFTNVWKNVAEQNGFIVLVPESMSGGASWNRGKDTPVISALYDEVAADYNVDECRLYLTGYSAGAHVTYMIGLFNSEFFAGLGIQAGSMQFAEQDGIWPNAVNRKIAVDIQHGQNDNVVPLSHAQHAANELEAAGHVVYYSTHPGGHEIGNGDPAEMWANLSKHRLDE